MASHTYESLHSAVAARLSERSLGHSERVAASAGELAATYGVDVGAARLAGLLHDWDRDVPQPELLLRAHAAGLAVDGAEESFPYLLHAPLGAAELRETYPGLPEDVLEAVATHTVGAEHMSPLALVVYVADTIEPGRCSAAVDALRELVGCVSLEVLFAETYADSLRGLIDSRRQIHPQTVRVWNRIVGREVL